MSQKVVIISVAITGAVSRKKDYPSFSVTLTEQIEKTHKAYESGASLVDMNEWGLEFGVHVETGFEGNIQFDESRIAKDNTELVRRLPNMARVRSRPVATGVQAFQLLGLRLAH